MDRVSGDTCTLNLVHAGTSRGTHAIASRPSLPRGRRRGVPGDTKAGRSLALARRPSRKLVAMEAQAKAPATASGKDPPGAAEASERVEGGGDGASGRPSRRRRRRAAPASRCRCRTSGCRSRATCTTSSWSGCDERSGYGACRRSHGPSSLAPSQILLFPNPHSAPLIFSP